MRYLNPTLPFFALLIACHWHCISRRLESRSAGLIPKRRVFDAFALEIRKAWMHEERPTFVLWQLKLQPIQP